MNERTVAPWSRRLLALVASTALLAGVFVAAGTTPASAASAASAWEAEPNGSTSTANVLAVGSTITGVLQSTSSYDDDVFAVDVPADGRLLLDLRFPSDLGTERAYYVTVRNATGSALYQFPVSGGQSDGSELLSQVMFTPTGRVYVEVSGSDYQPSWGRQYSLTVGVTPGYVETEPNGSSAKADVLALGSRVSGSLLGPYSYDDDYYAVDVPADGCLTLDLQFPTDLGTDRAYYVTVVNATGSTLFEFPVDADQSDGSALRAQAMFVAKGRLFVTVSGSDYQPSWGRKYTLTATSTAGTVETEPNGSTAKADVLAVGTTVSGSLLGTSSYDDDYYSVDVPVAGRAILDVRFPSDLGADRSYDVNALNASGNQLYSFPLTGDRYDGSWLRSQLVTLPKGRVYIAVSGSDYEPSWSRAYSLAVSYPLTAAPVPTVTGTAKVGSVLTAQAGTWAPSPVTLTYQWRRNGTAIAGATKPTYTPTPNDAGTKLTVTVAGTKTGYTTSIRTSAAVPVPLIALTTTPLPKVTGTAKAGYTLTAQPGTWAPAPVALSYQWLRNGSAIPGASKSTYTLIRADAGAKISVKVTGTKAHYVVASKTSATLSIAK